MKRALAILLLLVVTLWAVAAVAKESVSELAEKLLHGKDFRVRTQAALALGASEDKAAVSPLCKGLDDSNDTVRAAAAAALAKLAKGGKSCLEARLKKETAANVVKMIKKAIRLLDEAEASPAIGKSTRFYIAFATTADHTGRGGSEVHELVVQSLRGAAGKGYAFAPPGETSDQAKKRLRKNPHVDGYLFEPEVHAKYTGGNVAVQLVINIYTYPEHDSAGSLERLAGQGDVSSKDTDVEDALIKRLCREAMDDFGRMASSVD